MQHLFEHVYEASGKVVKNVWFQDGPPHSDQGHMNPRRAEVALVAPLPTTAFVNHKYRVAATPCELPTQARALNDSPSQWCVPRLVGVFYGYD